MFPQLRIPGMLDPVTVRDLKRVCALAGIRNRYDFNSINDYISIMTIDDRKEILMIDPHSRDYDQIAERYPLVTPSEFLRRLSEYANEFRGDCWWEILQPGDEVIIAEREGPSSNYPFGFGTTMARYHGTVCKIMQIERNAINCYSDYLDRKYYNGDTSRYYLEEFSGYAFHSSMFVPMNPSMPKLSLDQTNSILKLL